MTTPTPQTTDGMSFSDAHFAYQIENDDPSPVDASGFMTSVDFSGYEVQTGEAYTGNGQTAILTAGKTSPAEITVNSIYTEKADDPTDKLWAAKEAKKRVRFLWYPKGNAQGNWEWASEYGYLTSVTPPKGEASSADPILTTFVLKSAKITHNPVPVI